MRPFRPGVRADVAREAIADLCDRGLAPIELLSEAARRLRRVVPYDTGAWSTIDPDTLLPTEMLAVDPLADVGLRDKYAQAEFHGADVNRFADLERDGHVAASLVQTTGGQLDRSQRHRTVHAPAGLGDEVRLLARSGGATWAIGCLTRADDVADFSPDEIRYVASIARLLGRGVRCALAVGPGAAGPAAAPGMLVVDAQGRLRSSTSEGRRWLTILPNPLDDALPPPVAWAALQAQATATRPGRASRSARVRVRTTAGWLLVHAEALADGAAGGDTGIVLEAASRAELLPLMLALHGLTPREREVTSGLVAGDRTDEIAARLQISTHTLRGHTKSVFAKVGVGSRAELTAELGMPAGAA